MLYEDITENEDINSLYVQYGSDCLQQLLAERQPIPPREEQELRKMITTIEQEMAEEIPMCCGASPLDTNKPNKIIYETQTARYIVKGSLPKTFDRMLVSLDVQHPETGLKYRCRLDLYEEKQTRKEAREAAEKLDLRSDLIETDLSQLCDLLEEHRENGLQAA